jgi:hypothetical protein
MYPEIKETVGFLLILPLKQRIYRPNRVGFEGPKKTKREGPKNQNKRPKRTKRTKKTKKQKREGLKGMNGEGVPP